MLLGCWRKAQCGIIWFGVRQLVFCCSGNSICRSLSKVFDLNGNIPPVIRPFYHVGIFDHDISAQLSFGSYLCVIKSLVSNGPELPSGTPQTYCGNGQDNGESSNNALIVVGDKFIEAPKENKRAHEKGGAIIIAIVVGGLLLVAHLYQAEGLH